MDDLVELLLISDTHGKPRESRKNIFGYRG
jgi:hypothetical protein